VKETAPLGPSRYQERKKFNQQSTVKIEVCDLRGRPESAATDTQNNDFSNKNNVANNC